MTLICGQTSSLSGLASLNAGGFERLSVAANNASAVPQIFALAVYPLEGLGLAFP
jgi:hypothetical protein